MDRFAYSVAPAQLHDLTNSTSCSVPPSYSSFSLSPVCSPASPSPFSPITKPQLLLLRAIRQLLAWSSTDAMPPPAASTMALSSDSALCQWALVLVLAALCLSLLLSLLVAAQIVARYTAAYWAAPREITSLLDTADSSLQENESYDRDVVAGVPRREDKIRLGRMLQEIQRASDTLREDLNNVLVGGHSQQSGNKEAMGMSTGAAQLVDQRQPVRRKASQQHIVASTTEYCSSSSTPVSPQLKTVARILWAARRIHIEDRLRRLDMLRMRFLVVYMSIVAATTTATADKTEKSAMIVAAAAASASTAPVTASAVAPTTPAPGRTSTSTSTATKRSRTPPTKATASRTAKLTRATAPALKHASSSTSSEDSSGDDSGSESHSSACSSPLMSAASMPTSPQSPKKTPASIVAASIAKAAADAIASGDTDGKYHPGSPTSPSLTNPPTISEAPGTPPGSGRFHPFLRSITEQQQLRSPPASPDPTSPTPDIGGFRRKPTRRVTALGIRPPEASPENNHRAGWMGVVQELQRSPLLQKRHTTIEMSMARQTK